jgi:hypothetical protein
MQAMCAEIAFLLLGVSPVTPPIRRSGPTCPGAGAGPLDGERTVMSAGRGPTRAQASIEHGLRAAVMNQTKRSHRTQLKKQVGRGDN